MAMATTLCFMSPPPTVPRICCSHQAPLNRPQSAGSTCSIPSSIADCSQVPRICCSHQAPLNRPQSAGSTRSIPSSIADCRRSLLAASVSVALGSVLLFAPRPLLADFLSYDHADMRGANLSGRDLKGAIFAACDCRLINLEGANLDSSTVTFAGFQGANLQNTSWVRSLADRVVFREANLKNANFTNAILSGSQFDGADITGADFTEAIVDKAQRLKMCKKAKGTNPVTGVETRESLFC